MAQYRISTAVKFDPSFDHGQSFFKSYWAGHLGRAKMNMEIWKARLKMASPETKRAIVNDIQDRIYKLAKLKTDMIEAQRTGNQDLLIKTMELIQRDKASRNTLAGQRIRAASDIKQQQTDRLIAFENAGPMGNEAAVIREMPKTVGPLVGKIDPKLTGTALLEDTNMKSAFTKIDQSFIGAATKASTNTEVDRVAADMLGQIMKMNTGKGGRGQLVKNALIQRLALAVHNNTNVKYKSGADMVNSLTMKYSDKALGVTQDQLAMVMSYGAGAYDPTSTMKQFGGIGAFGGTSPATIQSTSTTIDSEIKRLRGDLERAQQDQLTSRKEFDWLLSGGMGNLALRPVGSKLTPSPIADYLKDYASLYQADPEYAEQYLESQERFVKGKRGSTSDLPTPFQELSEEPETRYMSGSQYVQDSITELQGMFGPTAQYAPEVAVQVARQKLIEMSQAMKSGADDETGLIDPSVFSGTIPIESGGTTYEMTLKDALGEAEEIFNSPDVSEDEKNLQAKALSKSLIDSFSPSIAEGREDIEIGINIGDRIKSAMSAKDSGDTSSHYGQLTQLYNDITQRPRSTWGGAESSFVAAVQENLLDDNRRNVGVFDHKMRGLITVIDPPPPPEEIDEGEKYPFHGELHSEGNGK